MKRQFGSHKNSVLIGLVLCMLMLLWATPAYAATIYFDDNADGTYEMSWSWPWGATTSDYYSNPRAYYWNYNDNYSGSRSLYTQSSFSLVGSVNPYLTFRHLYDLETDVDFARVEISTNGGSTWTALTEFTGSDYNWSLAKISLNAYKTSNNVRLRFIYFGNNNGSWINWTIDDIRVAELNPTVTSTTPSSGETNIPTSTTITAAFDRAMDSESINSSTFTVKDGSNNEITGTVTYSGQTATFTPSKPLAYSTTYTATITTGAKCVDGEALNANHIWSFQTKPTDAVAPTGSVSFTSASTTSVLVTLQLNASDDNSGVAKMQFSNTNGPWDSVPWRDYSTTAMWLLSAGEGEKTVYARFKDHAGNIGAATPATINYQAFGVDFFPPYTKVPRQTITGTVDFGWSVYVSTDTWASDGPAIVEGNTWRYVLSDLVAGENKITIKAVYGEQTKTIETSINLVGYFWDYGEGVRKMHPYGREGDWTVMEGVYNTPTHSYSDSPIGDYEPSTMSWLYSDTFSLSGAGKPYVYFKHKYNIPSPSVGYVQAGGTYIVTGFSTLPSASFNGTQSSWVSAAADLSSRKGQSTVRIRFLLDTKQNVNDGWYIDDIFVGEATDSIPPTGSFLINNGAVGTNSTSVTLNLSATDSENQVSLMQFSNDMQLWSSWEDFDSTKSWVITEGTGLKNVYVRFKDSAGNVSAIYNQSINLDNTPPESTLDAGTPDTVKQNSLTITGTANDENPVNVKITTNTEASEGYALVEGIGPNYTWEYTITHLAAGANEITITASDAGNNTADPIVHIVDLDTSLDSSAPSGSITINNGATHTNSINVTLQLSADDNGPNESGVAKMQFSNDGITWDPWVLYRPTYSWTLPTGDGVKNVYVKFRDAHGRESISASDDIILDTIAPVINIDPVTSPTSLNWQDLGGSIYDENGATVSFSATTGASGPLGVAISWNATVPANTSIVMQAAYSTNAGVTWEPWQQVNNGEAFTIPGGKNTRLKYKAILETTDTSVSPQIHSVTVNILPNGYYSATETTQADFSTGTLDNVMATFTGDIELSGQVISNGKTYEKQHSTYNWHDTLNAEFTDGQEATSTSDARAFAYRYYTLGASLGGVGSTYITVNLGSTQWVQSAKLCSGANYYYSGSYYYAADVLEILTSTDGINFTSRGSTGTVNNPSKYLTVNFAPVQAQYVRFRMTKQFNGYYLFVDEGYIESSTRNPSGSRTSPDINPSSGMAFNENTPYYAQAANSDQLSGTWNSTVYNLVDGNNKITVTAVDAAGNKSSASTTINSAYSIYWNDGTDVSSMAKTGTWGLTDSGPYSAPTCWTDSPAGSYSDSGVNEYYLTSPVIDMTKYNNPWMTLWLKHSFASGVYNSKYDEGEIQYTTNGTNWYNLRTHGASSYQYYRGTNNTWNMKTYYLGGVKQYPEFRLRVRMATNGDGVGGDGIYIDDIRIFEKESISPYVVAVFPREGAENVSVNTPVYGWMNEPLYNNGGIVNVTGPKSSTSDYITAGSMKIQSYINNLPYDSVFTVRIYNNIDANMNTQEVEKQWTFRTEKDTYIPTGCSVVINNSSGTQTWTNSPLVSLTLNATDVSGVAAMRFSNDNVSWSPWEAYSTTRDWVLSPGDGTKTVYAQFKDPFNNVSGVVQDTILMDTVAPTLSINPVTSLTNIDHQLIGGSVFDLNTATVYVETDTEASNGSATVSDSHLVSGSWQYDVISFESGNNGITVTATDPAGNITICNTNIFFDTVLPKVIATSPLNNTIEVPTDAVFSATLSEPMNGTTLNGTTVLLKDGANNPVAGTVYYDGSSVTFTPNSALALDTLYRAAVTTEAKDLAGNGLASDYTWSFKTIDRVHPVVSGTNPVDSGIDVPINKIISITLSEPVTKGPNFFGINLKAGSTVVEATYSITGSVLLIHPNTYLDYSTAYTVTLPAGTVLDLAGNDMESQYTFNFTTVGENAPPPPFTSIAAGTDHSAAIRGDGAVVSWGANDDGQLGNGQFTGFEAVPVLVRDADGAPWVTDISQLSAGGTHSAIVRNDGSVWAWGQNATGQLGNGVPDNIIGPPFGKLSPVRANFAGANWVYSAVYQADFATGTLTGAAATSEDNLELSMTKSRMRTKYNTNAFENGYTVSKDGGTQASTSLYGWTTLANAWRWNNGGSLTFSGFGYFEIANSDFSTRTVIPLANMNQADRNHYSQTFSHDGVNWQVKYGWSITGIFMMEIQQTSGETKPFKIRFGGKFGSTVENWGSVPRNWQDSDGEDHTLYTWWHNDNLVDELNKACPQFTFTVVPFSSTMNKLHAVEPFLVNSSANSYRIETLSLTEGTTLYFQWGNAAVANVQNWILNDINKELSYPASGTLVSPELNIASVNNADSSNITWNKTEPALTSVSVDTNLSLNGGLTWLGWQAATSGEPVPGISNGIDLSNARLKYRVNLATADTYATPQLHSLGINITTNAQPFAAAAVYAGTGYTLALKEDGTVWAWGANNLGQLGGGLQDNNPHPTPVQVTGLSGITALATGGHHILALKNDGTVWAWGDNTFGQLGDGSYSPRFTPVQIPGLTNIVSVAAGTAHSAAVTNTGTIMAWGDNTYGQLGCPTASLIKSNVPVEVLGVNGATYVDGGNYYVLALKADGTVWAWGRNDNGQLGNGNLLHASTPGKVMQEAGSPTDLTDVVNIAAGGDHNLALKSNGTLWSWGRNHKGGLGSGERTNPLDKTKAVSVVYDTTGPVVTATTPANGAVGIANNAKITVTFDEPIDPLTVNAMSFVVSDAVTGKVYSGTVSVKNNTATFTPANPMGVNVQHKVIFKPGVKDLAGNPATTSYVWYFTTKDVAGPNCEVIINSNDEYATSSYVSLAVSSDDDSGVVSHMQFSNDNMSWAPWQTYQTNTNWTLSPGDGPKRVYVRFRDPAGNSSNVYYDDIVLHTDLPSIIGTNVLGAVYMPADTDITVIFNESVKPGMAYDAIVLRDVGGNIIPINRTIAANTLIIEPLVQLAHNTLYTIIIPQHAVADIPGIELPEGTAYSFTVGPDTLSPAVNANPGGGTYIRAVTVSLAANEKADIFYTTDGTKPTVESNLYTGPLTVVKDTDLKYVAIDTAGNSSQVYSENYIIDPTAERYIGEAGFIDKPVIFETKVLFGEEGLQSYDVHTNAVETVIDSAYGITFADFDPVYGKAAYNYYNFDTGEKGLLVYDLDAGEIRFITTYSGQMAEGAVSGSLVVYYDEATDETKVLDTKTGEERLISQGIINQIDICGDKVIYFKNGQIILHNLETGLGTDIVAASNVENLNFGTDQSLLFWTDASGIHLYDLAGAILPRDVIENADNPFLYGDFLYYDQASDVSRHVYGMNVRNETVSQYTYSAEVQINTAPVFYGDRLIFKRDMQLFLRDFNVEPPVVTPSHSGTYYPGPINVSLGADKLGTEIYYTVNDENPLTSENRQKYSEPIAVDKNTTLKFYGVDSHNNNSGVLTKSYVIGNDTIPPEMVSATVYDNRVVISYDEPLDDLSVPSVNDYRIYADNVLLSISSVSVNGAKVIVKTVETVVYGQDITMEYVGSGPLKDLAGINAQAANNYPVVNNSPVMPVSGVNLNKPEFSLVIGSSETLIATVTPANASNTAVTWISDDPAIAVVNQNGLVLAVGAGTTNIRVTTADGGFTAVCSVTVTNGSSGETGGSDEDDSGQSVAVTGVTLNKTNVSLTIGSLESLLATISPVDATNKTVTWSSDNLSVATVDSSGIVSAIGAGTAVITVTTIDGGFTATCTIVATAIPSETSGGGGGSTSPQTDTVQTMQITDSLTGIQSAEVTSTGGELVTVEGNVGMKIPANALQSAVQITVRPVSEASIPGTVMVKSGADLVSSIYDFGPHGTTFAKPITITLKFDKSRVTSIDQVAPYYLNETQGAWEVISDSRIDWEAGTVSFETTHFSKYAILVKKQTPTKTFEDVKNHWAKTFIDVLAQKGIVTGRSQTKFSPDEPITRAEFARMLVGALGLKPYAPEISTFIDTDKNSWYYTWVEAASKAGLVKGSSGYYKPNARINRQEMAVMIANSMNFKNKELEADRNLLTRFSDHDTVAAWAAGGLSKVVKAGIIEGRASGELAPQDSATRAEAAAMVKKMLDLIE